ncbi:DUF982 domain-containing protein [Rhizobium lusitanum]|jgi:hypothetical protein|uniref:DUF982 domain-containing protein n=1 Tax=Rhizobium lusitanum TaxID=293958 RepID=A0A1C3X618_9HYPH|nr:DUF982 domain-containing protein [Rhizobium lusitanum]SCB47566.1 Protein of unknown function [Rhizobium lusitanum]
MVLEEKTRSDWNEPVYVQVARRAPDTIHNPTEALNFLANAWKGSRKKHSFAREICAAAALGQVSPETAREAFVEAASEARMVIGAPHTEARS